MITIIGGNFGDIPKQSSVVRKIETYFKNSSDDVLVKNGGTIDMLPTTLMGLSIWMPNVDNETPKQYPSKNIGTCLIVSKVVRNEPNQHKYTEAVSRIFKMNGNAVIAIENIKGLFEFSLIDALGNIWITTTNIEVLCSTIIKFYDWHNKQERRSISKSKDKLDITSELFPSGLSFLDIVRRNANNIMNNSGTRYFGNCSTRCQQTFPSMRLEELFLFSPRNSDKNYLTLSDMIIIKDGKYIGDKKPSVDTPVQLELYKRLPNINYMIHGHAFLEYGISTDEYYVCGDIREIESIMSKLNPNCTSFMINLKGHGYLIGADSITTLSILTNNTPKMMPFRDVSL